MKAVLKNKFSPLISIAFLWSLGLVLGGCVVGNDEFDEATRERNQYLDELQTVRQNSDRLNQDIAKIYNDCDYISAQLAMVAALTMHNNLTADLGKSRPATPAPQRQSTTTRPRATEGARTGTNAGGTAAPRPNTAGTNAPGTATPGANAAGTKPQAPPPQSGATGQPPAGKIISTPPSGGSVDWGTF